MHKKLIVAIAIVLVNLVVYAHAQESIKFDSESKKLEFIRQMLKEEKYLRFSSDVPPIHGTQFCVAMMKDFLRGRNFKAIEPDVRADSIDDPRLAKWNQCRDKDYYDDDIDMDVDKFFNWLPQLGGPQYRYYRIELDGNRKNGPEDMIYHETPPNRQRTYNQTGYTWVDLKKCEIKGGFPVTGSVSKISKKHNAIYLNCLVYYKGKLWAANFVDGFGFAFLNRIDRNRIDTCQWFIFGPETIDMSTETGKQQRTNN